LKSTSAPSAMASPPIPSARPTQSPPPAPSAKPPRGAPSGPAPRPPGPSQPKCGKFIKVNCVK
jgi:hypothetical protein